MGWCEQEGRNSSRWCYWLPGNTVRLYQTRPQDFLAYQRWKIDVMRVRLKSDCGVQCHDGKYLLSYSFAKHLTVTHVGSRAHSHVVF